MARSVVEKGPPAGGAEPRPGLFERWARFAYRRRGSVLLGWLGAFIALIVIMQLFGGPFSSNFTLPGTESQRAFDLLKNRFPAQSGDDAQLVFKADGGVTTPETRARVEEVLNRARQLPGVDSVGSPFEQGGGGVSQDSRIAYTTVQYRERATEMPASYAKDLIKLIDSSGGNGLTVEGGGQVIENAEAAPPGSSEIYGLVGAVIILLLAFGSVVAMGLPVATALVGLGASFAGMALLANVLDLPDFTSAFAGMIGIGVGIDYALLIVTRFREGLHNGHSVEDSVVLAIATAGRSVAFAGMVVVIAMLGLLANGIPFIGGLGIGGALVVALAVLVALTLLPALLSFAGRRVNSLRLPWVKETAVDDRSSIWYKLSSAIQRRPWVWAIGSLGVLLLLASPVLSMNLGFSDAGNASEKQHTRRAYDLLVEGFGPGFNGPLTVVLDLAGAGANGPAAAAQVQQALAAASGIAQVSPPIPNPAGDTAIIRAIPSTKPQDKQTQSLIHNLRRDTLPPAVQGTGIKAYVAGPTAAFIDIGDRIVDRLPIFFGAVIGLSFLLLMVVFRSVLVPLKAAIMNLLSIGASYGVLVAIFQWGWGSSILGIKAGPIETFLPMMLFAILFGLSMDYEVFLISRIREEYTRTGDNADSVAHGLAVTARVITAAAAIMVVVFLSFVLGPDRIIKEFGIGLATAIFVDATIVRLILVPSTMELLGDANWWLPGWLGRILPRLDVEGHNLPVRFPTAGAAADD